MSILLSLNRYTQKKFFLSLFLSFFCVFFFCSCKKTITYFDYVSELRSNIFLGKTESFSLRIYAVDKESPYSTDGVPRETFSRMEAYLVAPEGNKTANFTFKIEEKTYSGEMSYDMVKGEYYYACPIDVSSQSEIICSIEYDGVVNEIVTTSVLTQSTISPKAALEKLQKEKAELFSSLTDKYGFAGEIYLRLISEGSPYYYIGIMDRNGNCTAFLMNAETGKILAERKS